MGVRPLVPVRIGLAVVFGIAVPADGPVRADAVSCGCYCGISLSPPCSDDACKSACGWSGGEVPIYTPNPLLEATGLYDGVVQRLAPYLDNGGQWLAAAPPVSIEDLHERLQNFYASLWMALYRAEVSSNLLRGSLEDMEWDLQKTNDAIVDLRREIPDLAARDAGQRARLADARRTIEEQRDQMRRFEGESSYWRQRTQQVQGNVIAWLTTFGPDRLLKVSRETLLYAPILIGPGSVRLFERDQLPAPLPAAWPAPAAALAASPPPNPVPWLQGDTSSRVAEIDGLAPRLDAERRNAEYYRQRIDAVRPQLDAVRAERDQAMAERNRLAASVTETQAQLHGLDQSVRQTVEEVRAARESFAFRVAEAWLWESWREAVVKVELQRFAEKNMLWGSLKDLTDEEVDALFQSGKKAWSFYAWRGRDDFVAVQDKTLTFINQTEGFAEEATRLLALRSPGEIQAFADEVFGRLDAQASDLAKTALRDLTGFAPFDMVAHRLIGFGN